MEERPKQQWEIDEENDFLHLARVETGCLMNELEDLSNFLTEEKDRDRVIQNVARFLEEAKKGIEQIDNYLIKISQKN